MAETRHLLQEALGADPSRISVGALMEALRLSAEGVSRVAEQSAEHARVLRDMSETLHNMDKRLAIIENGGAAAKIDDHEKRLALLEAERNRREGAIGFGGWLMKNWPGAAGLVALFAVLAERGVVKL